MRLSHRTITRHALVLAMLVAPAILLSAPRALTAPASAHAAHASESQTSAATMSALDFRNEMRRLWEDHVGWTRLYIISVFGNLPDKELAAQRLLRNQDDIGNAIKPYYGEAAGNQLATLLREHITGAAELLEAAKAGNTPGIEAGKSKWYANADQIAAFLDSANPKAWNRNMIASTMKMHLDLTLEEAVARLQGDWSADVAAYDQIHEHILLTFADALSMGIIEQFPDRFTLAPPDAEVTFRNDMRKAWEDHIIWTRLFIVSALADLPDVEAATQRLLQDQVDIGNLVKPYYGEAAGNQLAALLRDHILGAAELLGAAKTGDSAAVQSASDKWYANGDDIAAFLNSANPTAWPLEAVKAEMKMHLDLTLEEAVAHMKGEYETDIARYDQIHHHILGLADTLSSGVIAQFPEKFAGTAGGGSSRPTAQSCLHDGGYAEDRPPRR